MGDIVKLSHDAGLEVWSNPWGVGNVFGGEPFSNFASQNLFNACQILDDGNPTAIACPNSPEFIEFMESWLFAVHKANVDTILWDEPHFHEQGFLSSVEGKWGCRCEYCQVKYENDYDSQMPIVETSDVKVFKKKSLLEFIARLAKRAKELGIKNVLYLTANLNPEDIPNIWADYFIMESIDIISTGPYWQWAKEDIGRVQEYAENIAKLSKTYNKEVQIWIQGFKILKGKETEVSTAIDLVRKSGIKNIAVWGYEGCSQQSWVSCGNPELVWESILSSIQNT